MEKAGSENSTCKDPDVGESIMFKDVRGPKWMDSDGGLRGGRVHDSGEVVRTAIIQGL